MQDESWDRDGAETEGQQQIIEEFDLNTGGLVGAVTSIERTGQLLTGTRNDDSSWSAFLPGPGRAGANADTAAPLDNRLTVHTIRDIRGRVLGLGPLQRGGDDFDDGGDEDGVALGVGGGWEPVVEAWTPHEGAVTGIDVAGGFGNLGGVSGVVTSGGDGFLRLFELVDSGDQDKDFVDNSNSGDESMGGGPSLHLRGQVAAHTGRATGVAATRRRAVTVGEDGVANLVDLQRLAERGEGSGGAGNDEGGAGGERVGGGAESIIWSGAAKGALPLSAVTFQGESDEVFATVGCDPRKQLLVWDARANGTRPVVTAALGCLRDSSAPYLCVASQPFNPEVFACGVSTGELLLWDVRAGDVLHELQAQDQNCSGGGTWGVAFHPRRPRHLFSCSGAGVLTKWYLPPEGQAPPAPAGPRFGESTGESWAWRGAKHLYALSSRAALVGVCYDEAADTISTVSKHGHVVVAQGVPGLRL